MSRHRLKSVDPQRPRRFASRPLLVAGVAVAATVAACAYWLAAGRSDKPSGPAGLPSVNARFRVGLRCTYDLEYEVDSTLDFRSLLADTGRSDGPPVPGATRRPAASVRGRMETVVVARDSHGRFLLRLRVADARVELTADGAPATDVAAGAADVLRRGLFLAADPDGRIREAWSSAAGDKAASYSFGMEAVAACGLVLPQSAADDASALRSPTASWQTVEEDGGGEFTVQYRAEGPADADRPDVRTFRKVRLPYESASGASDDAQTRIRFHPDGDTVVDYDFARPAVVRVQADTVSALSVGGRPVGQVRVRLRLNGHAFESIGESERAALEQSARAARTGLVVRFADFRAAGPDPAAAHRAALGDTRVEQIVVRLDALDRSAKPDAELGDLPAKLRALVYLRPEDLPALTVRLARAPARSPSMVWIAGTLGRNGRPEAQEALVSVIRARQDDKAAMLMLVPPLGTAPLLTVQSEELLRETATRAADADVRSTAQLALGAAVQGLARGAPERARALVGWFGRELRAAAADPDATRQWLLVLGNTGHPDALEPVLACLSSPGAELRTAAVGSLRFIPDARAAEALLRALREDKAAEVRAEAIWALRFRAPSAAAVSAAGATLAGDPAQSVRLAAVEFLQNARSTFPEAAAALARAAREDGDEKVRKAAAVEPQPNE